MSIRIEFKNVSFRYKGIGASDRLVLNDISFIIDRPECIGIIGHSGSGKTTLIQHFTGLLKPDSGTILVDGRDIFHAKSLGELRKRIGLVFQFPEHQLFEETVEKDIAFGPKNLGYQGDELNARVHSAMEAVDLSPKKFSHRSPFKISEGEKRRAAIAGVLAMDPDMIVFDEPTAGLDARGVRTMQKIIRRLLAAGKTVVVVTHHMDFMAEICNRVMVLVEGAIAFDGNTRELFKNDTLLEYAGLELPSFLSALRDFPSLPRELRHVSTFDEFVSKLNGQPDRSPKSK